MSDQTYETLNQERAPRSGRRLAFFIIAALTLAIALGLYFWMGAKDLKPGEKAAIEERADEHSGSAEVELSEEALEAAKIEYGVVTERTAVALIRVTGTVEANQQHVQDRKSVV